MAAEYLYLTYGGIQFLVYQQTKASLSAAANNSRQRYPSTNRFFSSIISSSSAQSFVSGATAGIMATACTYPFDLLRTRFAVQREVKVSSIANGCSGTFLGQTAHLHIYNPFMALGVHGGTTSISTYLSQGWNQRILQRNVAGSYPSYPIHGHHVWIVRHTQAAGIVAKNPIRQRHIIVIFKSIVTKVFKPCATRTGGYVMWSHVRSHFQNRCLSSGHGSETASDPRVRPAKGQRQYFEFTARRFRVRSSKSSFHGCGGHADHRKEDHGAHCASGGVLGSVQGTSARGP